MSIETYSEGFNNFLTQHYASESERMQRQSAGFLIKTLLPREIRKIREKKEGIIYSQDIFNKEPPWKVAEESCFTGCAWGLEMQEMAIGRVVVGKGIAVEAFSNGSIIVHGSPSATTLILLSEWKNNRDVLFKALGKAMTKPMTIIF